MGNLTDEDLKMLREAQERGRRALGAPAPTSLPLSMAIRPLGKPGGKVEYVPRCEGGCYTPVARRHDWCASCASLSQQRERERVLIAARRSVSPDDALEWCRVGTPEYADATKGARARARGDHRRLLETAAWNREMGSMLVLGATEIGKSKFLTAAALRVLDLASTCDDQDSIRFAAGIRRVSALDIARAREQAKFGDEPEIVKVAKRATLLILDEVGFEDMRMDPYAVRDLLRARYEPVRLPTFVASGMTFAELETRYGVPTIRTLASKGIVIDLHPRTA
jgi:DNA replication protein DnaC